MAEKGRYTDLEHKIEKLEKEVLDYMRRERELIEERRLVDRGQKRRTISLLKINEELSREIKKIRHLIIIFNMKLTKRPHWSLSSVPQRCN